MDKDDFNFDKEQLYDALIRSTDDYIYMCYWPKNIFLFPQNMVEEFNLPGQIIEDADTVWGALIHEDDKEAFFQAIIDINNGLTNVHNVEYRAKNRLGEWVWLRCRGYLERDKEGNPELFAGIITNLGQKNKIDHVTGLFNKFEFENQLNLQLSKPESYGSILILGLDDFKHVNDLYNREFGDEVLRITSQKIQTLLPSSATIYRLDGDEFGVIINNAEEEQTYQIYERVQKEFQHQQSFNGKKYYSTISGGCSLFPRDGNTFASLFKYAEYSLEFSKMRNKNRISFYNKEIMVKKYRSLELVELLRESVEQNFKNFELYYQPQVDAHTRKLKGAEALLRWHCKKYGSVSPVEFIPLLEQTGLIIPVGKWIFEQAISTCTEWVKQYADFMININLSYFQLIEEDFIPFMKYTIEKNNLSPNHVVVELTESYIASQGLIEKFAQIRKLGIRIAMDDFGTGYSSLEILKTAPTDVVKIDRAFVKDILSSTFDATFIRFIVALCHDVKIEICLEGVETEEEYQVVSKMELDLIQGYLFGKPQSKTAFCEQYLLRPSRRLYLL